MERRLTDDGGPRFAGSKEKNMSMITRTVTAKDGVVTFSPRWSPAEEEKYLKEHGLKAVRLTRPKGDSVYETRRMSDADEIQP
jgi:glyceraldehyde-3-phosphate dehydrogenase/erythrose-4-phosphate dehydrogenase